MTALVGLPIIVCEIKGGSDNAESGKDVDLIMIQSGSFISSWILFSTISSVVVCAKDLHYIKKRAICFKHSWIAFLLLKFLKLHFWKNKAILEGLKLWSWFAWSFWNAWNAFQEQKAIQKCLKQMALFLMLHHSSTKIQLHPLYHMVCLKHKSRNGISYCYANRSGSVLTPAAQKPSFSESTNVYKLMSRGECMCMSISIDVHWDLHQKVNTPQNELICCCRRLKKVHCSLKEAWWDWEGAC